MNKKISILAIIFSGILSTGALADEIDASERGTGISKQKLSTDGSGLQNIQGYLNTASNVKLPGSDPTTGLIGTGSADRKKPSTFAQQNKMAWGTTVRGENYVYKTKINGVNASNCHNSPVTANGEVSSSCEYDSEVKSKTTRDASGYLKNEVVSPNVIFEPDNDSKHFYKYWISKENLDRINTNSQNFTSPDIAYNVLNSLKNAEADYLYLKQNMPDTLPILISQVRLNNTYFTEYLKSFSNSELLDLWKAYPAQDKSIARAIASVLETKSAQGAIDLRQKMLASHLYEHLWEEFQLQSNCHTPQGFISYSKNIFDSDKKYKELYFENALSFVQFRQNWRLFAQN